MFANYMFNKVAPAATCFAYLLETPYTQAELKGLTHSAVLAGGKVLAYGQLDCQEFGFKRVRQLTGAFSMQTVPAFQFNGEITHRLRSGKIANCLVATFDIDAFNRSVQYDASEVNLSRTYVSMDDATQDIILSV